MSDTLRKIEYTPFGSRVVNLGYDAATKIRTSGRATPQGGSADRHLWLDHDLLRAEAQRFDRDNGLYRGILNRALDNILGDGFSLQAKTGNRNTNRKAEALWNDWCQQPEARKLDDWPAVERLVLRHLINDGDVGGIKVASSGMVQMIESERIVNPSGKAVANMGVECDTLGVPVKFHIADYDANGNVKRKTTPITAENFVYVAIRDRISQTRGLPAMVCNFPMFHRINDVLDSEAVAWQILSKLAVAITRENAESLAFNQSTDDASASTDDIAQRYSDFGEGIVWHGKPGESIKGIDRNIPGANFSESVTTFLRLLGLPLGLPLELVLLDWSRTNYSSARAALLQAYRMFTNWQRLLMRRWHTPIYRWKVQQWIDQKELPRTAGTFNHLWVAPPFPWIDPLKDAQAEGEKIDRGYSTFGQVLLGRNIDRETFIAERMDEVADAIEAAKKLTEDTGEKVPWQMFAGVVDKPAAAAAPVPQNQPTDAPGDMPSGDMMPNEDNQNEPSTQDEAPISEGEPSQGN